MAGAIGSPWFGVRYMGSTIVGYVGGLFWTGLGWGGVAGLVGLLIAVRLWRAPT